MNTATIRSTLPCVILSKMIKFIKRIMFILMLGSFFYLLILLMFNHIIYQYFLNQSQYQIQSKYIKKSLLRISYDHPTIYIQKKKINLNFDKLLVGLSPFGFIEAVGMCQKYYVDIKYLPFETIITSDGMPSFCIDSNLSNIFYDVQYHIKLNHNGMFGTELFRNILIDNVSIKFIRITIHHNTGLMKIGCDNTIKNYKFYINYDDSNKMFNVINPSVLFTCNKYYFAISGNILTPQISLLQNNLTNR